MTSHEEQLQNQRNPVTLTRYLLQERKRFPHAQGDFQMLLQSVQLACKIISSAVSKAGIANMFGLAGSANKTGDDQKKLDVFANECFINCVKFSKQVFAMVSEEVEEPIFLNDIEGGYAIAFDPLDGSSNIDCNVSVGTIFGIYRRRQAGANKVGDLLRPGRELLAAGYALYGSATMMVLTTGNGVNGFTLDPTIGEFILTNPNIKMPVRGNIFSVNEGNFDSWDSAVKSYINKCKQKQKNGKLKSARYVGSMVADIHRTLMYGGIFMYPPDKKNKNGKLRLLYEGAPMAMLMEQAGGKASTGLKPILDVQPADPHCRVPVFMGSKEDVEEVEALYRRSKL